MRAFATASRAESNVNDPTINLTSCPPMLRKVTSVHSPLLHFPFNFLRPEAWSELPFDFLWALAPSYGLRTGRGEGGSGVSGLDLPAPES